MAGKALILLFALCALVAFAGAETGDATAYSEPYDKDSTGFNACGFGRLEDYFERMFAAMNYLQFDGTCGRCIKVQGTDSGASGKWYTVKIIDNCPTCNRGDVDFSSEAFEKITGHSWDRKKIRWEWTDCNDRSETTRAIEEPERETKSADVEEPVVEPAGPVQKQAGPVESGKLINVKQAVGTYTDWVLPCQAGRQRCTNLALASQGFQCMTLDNRACCLNGNGKNCWRLSRAGDDSTPDNWTGRELADGRNNRKMLRL